MIATFEQVALSLAETAKTKGISGPTPDESAEAAQGSPDESAEPVNEQEWELAMPEDGKARHMTVRKQEKADRYRITLETHQLVTGFMNPDEVPQGHCLRSILIVPGREYGHEN